jgi:proline iminopeptidase
MKSAILFLTAFLFARISLADESVPFVSGKALREATLSSSMKPYFQTEMGDYIDVPLDYNDLTQGKISIYYYLNAPLDLNKPTMVYFQGGPGGASHMAHQFEELTDWNVIYLDYRGIGFSFPETMNILKTTRYFTSEFVARDTHSILTHLGVKKVSVYGHSYGTVVATIFASLFSEMTKAVVLEGTVFNGEEDLWNASHRQKILQKYFDQLPLEIKVKILQYSNHSQVNPAWFSRMAQRFMYSSNFKQILTEALKGLFEKPEDEIIPSLAVDNDIDLKYTASPFFSEYFFFQIACKELSGQSPHASFGFIFKDEKLTPAENRQTAQGCKDLGIGPELIKTYSSLNYPIAAPVTYFQGAMDGATVAPHAIWHYKNTAKNSAQLFISKNAGHGPMTELLTGQDLADHQVALALTRLALNGQILTKATFKELKKQNLSNWVMTSK